MKTGDAVTIEYDGQIEEGDILLASGNSISLMLGFEAILGGYAGMMPVMKHDDGQYRELVNNTVVIVKLRR